MTEVAALPVRRRWRLGRRDPQALRNLGQRWWLLVLVSSFMALSAGCGDQERVKDASVAARSPVWTHPSTATSAQISVRAPRQPAAEVLLGTAPVAAAERAPAVDHPAPLPRAGADVRSLHAAAAQSTAPTPSVEELLEQGYRLAGVSPVHLAIRGTPAANSVRCAWRGIARTTDQREAAIRFWLDLAPTDPIPDAGYLQTLFAVVLSTTNPDFRETAKANFLAIARGGESMDYLFLTCFADYAVTNFLLGTGTTPTTVKVAYDRMGEAASYDLYVREHDTGTYGTEALQTRGDYEAGLQAQVVAAEAALSADIGGREAVVFLAPMGAHNAIGFEAWQAVASWAVVTDDANVVQAVRDDTPAGDPEHTQTLANLTSRITTAAGSDGTGSSG